MADPILNGKPVKPSKNGSDVICLSAFHDSSCSSILDCLWTFNLFWGQSQQKAIAVVKLWQNETDSNAACSFACDVWTDFTQRSDVEKKKRKDLTKAEICRSMEGSGCKVAPGVVTTLDNRTDVSPNERQSQGHFPL